MPGSSYRNAPTKRRRFCTTVLEVLYWLFLVGMIAMVSLEIARLSAAHLGLGLLPFTYVGLILVGATRLTRKTLITKMVNVLFWVMLGVSNIIKISAEVDEGIGSRKGTAYPMVDEITDVAVMIVLCGLLAILESIIPQQKFV